jgi:Beta-xylosidase
MKRIKLICALVLFFAVKCFAQQTSVWGDLGNGAFRNPVLSSDYSDPDVIRVGSDYYGIASTFCFSPGMIIIHSRDLVNWEIIGHVVDDISFLNPELKWNQMKGYYNGIWAGSLRFHNGMFYCHFTTPRGGWFVATTNDIRGKWNVQAMKDRNDNELRGKGWDDTCPLWDDDGQAYIIASNFGHYWFPHLYKMSSNGTKLEDGMIDPSCDRKKNIEIIGGYITKPNRTAEASKLYKWNGMYYFYFSEVRTIHGNQVRVPVMLRSKNMYGPYEEKLLIHSQGKDVDLEPNQGAIVDTPDGKWYFVTQHGTGNFDGRMMSVLPVTWVDGWPMIGKDIDNDGVGEMVWEMEKPVNNEQAKESIQTTDFFSSSQLSPQWEWNHQPRAEKWSLTERKGHLRLYAYSQLEKGSFFTTGNIISQRYIRYGKCEIIIKMDIRNIEDGQEAGLTHFNGGRDYSCLGVKNDNGQKQLCWSKKQSQDKDVTFIKGNTLSHNIRYIWLKTVINFSGEAIFSWSFNGKSYHTFGGKFQLAWGNYRGSRIGVYTYNNRVEKGFVDVDFFSYKTLTR